MDLYSQKSASVPQKIVILLLETIIIGVSYWLLFSGGYETIFRSTNSTGNNVRHVVLFTFNCIVFIRICITMFWFIKRRIPWLEAINIPLAFGLYYIGFALLGYTNNRPFGWLGVAGVILFIAGSLVNTVSELLRYKWKKDPVNKGHLYTKGLFRYAMHINYFGDLLWVSGYALATDNGYSIFIVIFLFCFFTFYNIPMLDKHLASRYGAEFERYSAETKKLIPFVY